MNNELWSINTATIQSCEWEDSPSQATSSLFVGHYRVAYSYGVAGNSYSGEFYSSREWEKGMDLTMLYNPQKPGESIVCDGEESQTGAALEWLLGFIDIPYW
jgi:hypothetical protein